MKVLWNQNVQISINNVNIITHQLLETNDKYLRLDKISK